MTKIYICDNTRNTKTLEEILAEIPANIVEFPDKYKITGDKLLSASAWYMLYTALKEEHDIDLAKEQVVKFINRKPCIDGIFFNISHSFNISTVIISTTECGIDVEMVNPEVDYELMSRRILTKEEYFTYLHQRRAAYFTMMWTKKEAMFKYLGTGIVLNHFKLLDISKVQTIELDDSKNNLYYLSYRTADGEEVEDIRRIII